MTVCIAATAMVTPGEQLQVLCTDARMGSALGSADAYLKEKAIHKNWKILTAGNQSDIVALAKCFRRAITPTTDVTEENVDALMKSAAVARKRQIADEIAGTKFGMSFSELITVGKENFPTDIYYGILKEVELAGLGAEFIIAGFVGSSAEIYVCEQIGKVFPTDHFAAVGEGSFLATSVLLHRGQNLGNPLLRTIYNVFEAKKAAEATGSVGQLTILTVMGSDGSSKKMSPELYSWLNGMHTELGSKAVPVDLKFDGAMFV